MKDATRLHAVATTVLVEGIPARLEQERLGHSSVTTTHGIYLHTTPALHDHAAATLEASIFDDKVDDNQGEQR